MAIELQSKPSAPSGAAANPGAASFLQQSLTGAASVSGKDRMFFTEQLGLLLETGTSLHAALEALHAQTPSGKLRDTLQALRGDISEGRSFSQALAQHPDVFSSNYVNLIAASEQGGFMHEVLYQLLEMEEKREQLRSTLVSAFSYPLFLVAFSIGVVIFVLMIVFPKFGTLFVSIADQLPATTKILMALSDGLRNYWPILLGATGALGLGLLRWRSTQAGREVLDGWKLKLPVIKDIFVQLYLIQTLRVLSLSLRNGVPMVDALAAGRDVVENLVFRRFIGGIQSQVEEGRGLAAGFEGASFVPPTVKQMIATAEESGNLAKVMLRLAAFYERELGKRLATFAKLAEPFMLLIMGAVVGLLVSSLILPIFKLSRAVS